MAALAPAIPIISAIAGVAGTVMSATAARNEGIAQQQQADYQAAQMKIQAGQERAAAQRKALSALHEKDLVQSKAQANAAGSGAGALDPSVVDIMGDLEQQGQYNANVATYEGEDRGRNLESGAALKIYEGKQAKAAGNTKAIGALISGGSSLLSKYGDSFSSSGKTYTDGSVDNVGSTINWNF